MILITIAVSEKNGVHYKASLCGECNESATFKMKWYSFEQVWHALSNVTNYSVINRFIS